jgi:hydrogenase maturation protease
MLNPRQLALSSGCVPLLDSPLVGEHDASRVRDGAGAEASVSVLVLGVGNILMGDEGVGVQILRQLELEEPIAGVRLLDGGTGGVNLLAEFDGVEVVILIDATRDGKPAGTVTYLQPKRVGELPRGLGAHDFGLKDLFAAAALLGRLPELHLYTIAVEEVRPMCMELSPAVTNAIGPVVAAIRVRAAQLSDDYRVRDALSLRKTSAARTWPTDAQL